VTAKTLEKEIVDLQTALDEKTSSYKQLYAANDALSTSLTQAKTTGNAVLYHQELTKAATDNLAQVVIELANAKRETDRLQKRLDNASESSAALRSTHDSKLDEMLSAHDAALKSMRSESNANMQKLRAQTESTLQEQNVKANAALQQQIVSADASLVRAKAKSDAQVLKLRNKSLARKDELEMQQQTSKAELRDAMKAAKAELNETKQVLIEQHRQLIGQMNDTMATKKRKHKEKERTNEQNVNESRRNAQVQEILKLSRSESSSRSSETSDLSRVLREWNQQSNQQSRPNQENPRFWPQSQEPQHPHMQENDGRQQQHLWHAGNSGPNQQSPINGWKQPEGQPTSSSLGAWTEERVLEKYKVLGLEKFHKSLTLNGLHLGSGLKEVTSYEELEAANITDEQGNHISIFQLKSLVSAITNWKNLK
jgi:hypothetical protein